MLNLMRKHARNWLMKVILGIIIVVFVFYFGSMNNRDRANRIAMMDGKPIVYADYLREYENMVDMYRQRFGQALSDEMLKSLNLKQQAYDNIINQAVVLAKAEAMNVNVTDDDVKSMILAYPGFQRNGAFDQRLYEQALRANKMTPDEFESLQKKMMVTLKVEDLIQNGITVSDQEVQEIYRMQNEKINVDYIQISPKAYADRVKASTADLEAYLKAHEGQFRVTEQVKIKYLAFSARDYAADAVISDADAADYYDRHKNQWMKDNKVQPLADVRDKIAAELRQVKGMYAAADEAKKAHDTIYQEDNFDAYATQKKLTVRTTDLFRLNEPPAQFRMIADFSKQISALQKNEIGKVMQGEKEYYLVMLVDRKAPYTPALKEIEAEVEKQFREAEAKNLAQKEADALLSRLKKGERLDALANEKGLRMKETGLFQPGNPMPGVGVSMELMEALYQISAKNAYPEKPYLVDGNFLLFRFKEKGQIDEADFAAKKGAISRYLAQQKRSETFQAWIEGSKAALLKEGRLELSQDVKDL